MDAICAKYGERWSYKLCRSRARKNVARSYQENKFRSNDSFCDINNKVIIL
jgi:hypothetical protein